MTIGFDIVRLAAILVATQRITGDIQDFVTGEGESAVLMMYAAKGIAGRECYACSWSLLALRRRVRLYHCTGSCQMAEIKTS